MSKTQVRAPGRWKPGQSGNPLGRPIGTSTAAKLREAIEADLPAILDNVILSAKAGDIAAARLLLERAIPALKPVELPVQVEVKGDTLTDQGRAILAAVASGQVAPMQGAALAYFSPSWTVFQADGGRDFIVVVDGVSV
jgi:hypothetical protein